jgi:hypothetical protein
MRKLTLPSSYKYVCKSLVNLYLRYGVVANIIASQYKPYQCAIARGSIPRVGMFCLNHDVVQFDD